MIVKAKIRIESIIENLDSAGLPDGEAENDLLRLCDVNNIPLATNIATAEVLILALDAGSFDWREFINPRSAYNQREKAKV